MGRVSVQAVFNSVTGLPEDRVVHDFQFRWDGPIGPTEAELVELTDQVIAFYNQVPSNGGLQAPGQYMSREVSRAGGNAAIRCYVHEDVNADAGSPALVTPFNLVNVGVSSQMLPAEVAIVCTLRADVEGVQTEIGDTRPLQRRTGRLYFGPINSLCLLDGASSSGADPAAPQRPNGSVLGDLRRAFVDLRANAANVMALNAGLFLSVYSRADGVCRDAETVYTDDAFDTQRRRGSKPLGRTTVSLV